MIYIISRYFNHKTFKVSEDNIEKINKDHKGLELILSNVSFKCIQVAFHIDTNK